MDTADVVVIGAGASGASIAFHLAQARAGKVVVVERAHLAAGATGKSGALVRMHYTNEPETLCCLPVPSGATICVTEARRSVPCGPRGDLCFWRRSVRACDVRWRGR